MSEQVKHTPTPWVIRYGAVNDYDEGFGIASTIGDPRIVCECYPCGTTRELRQQLAADARFIIEAVNSRDTLKKQRDALVALLTEARQEIYLALSKDRAVYDPTILTRIDVTIRETKQP